MKDHPTCEDRITDSLEGTLAHLSEIWEAWKAGTDEYSYPEYGLSLDYVPASTFVEQTEGYFRYQLSWGGPSTEFRFYADPCLNLHRVEYWYLDWFDGASITLEGTQYDLLAEIYEDWKECETLQYRLNEATQ